MRYCALVITFSAWIVFSGFQQPSSPQGKANQKSADATHTQSNMAQPKPLPTPPASARDTDTETNGIESHGKQNIQIVAATPEKAVDLVERIIGIAGAVCTLALAVVGGVIEYTDAFEISRSTTFRYLWAISDSPFYGGRHGYWTKNGDKEENGAN
jgi:hypothetical protein